MTNREFEILKLIKDNPMISQQDIAKKLEITRSSVAVHISNLNKKGYIKGKGYIINESPYISIIGGANIDLQGFPKDKLIYNDSNPGKMEISLGGVGRNIGENLSRMDIQTKLITVLGDDIYGNKILENSKLIGLDMNDSFILKDKSTSTYLSVLDETGDMVVAIASMDIFENMTSEFIKQKLNIINGSSLCIIDTNIPKETIEYILKNVKNCDFFIDTVSTSKAKKIKELIPYFHTIKPNKIEAEILSGIEIKTDKDLLKASEFFIQKGVKNVFITLGKDGVFFNNGEKYKLLKSKQVKSINATGGGDAFVAGLAYGYFNNLDIEESCKIAMAASVMAISHENTINPNINIEQINNLIKELEIC